MGLFPAIGDLAYHKLIPLFLSMTRHIASNDITAVTRIYNYYIRETTVSFEEEEIGLETLKSRIRQIKEAGLPWLVVEDEGQLVGYAYATPWKERSAYRFSVEVLVYVAHTLCGKGWGTKLYQALFTELQKRNIHLAIGGITLPNDASVALHEKFGMEKVAHFTEVGFKFGE